MKCPEENQQAEMWVSWWKKHSRAFVTAWWQLLLFLSFFFFLSFIALYLLPVEKEWNFATDEKKIMDLLRYWPILEIVDGIALDVVYFLLVLSSLFFTFVRYLTAALPFLSFLFSWHLFLCEIINNLFKVDSL